MKSQKQAPVAPAHLKPETAAWWASVIEEYELEAHHVRLLTSAAEAWDRATQAREILAVEGIVVQDRFGQPKQHPCTLIERDAKGLFMRCLRELALDIDEPGGATRHESRPPARTGKSHLKVAR